MDRSSVRPVWRRSPECGGGACVEVAFVGEHVLIRDSKHPAREPMEFTRAEWHAFKTGVVAGAFEPR